MSALEQASVGLNRVETAIPTDLLAWEKVGTTGCGGAHFGSLCGEVVSRHERIIGMKACNTDMYHFLQVIAGIEDSFAVLSGEDHLFPLHVASGARGGIVVTANLLPKAWRAIFEAAASGRVA